MFASFCSVAMMGARCACIVVVLFTTAALAQQTLTVEDLIGKLHNRAPAAPQLSVEDITRRQQNRLVVESAKGQAASGEAFSDVQRKRLKTVVSTSASVDLEIYFPYNSAAITPAATGQLIILGRALTDSRFSSATFLIAGHTDGKGGDAYNLDLSDRRAKSVRNFLISNFSVPPKALVAVGYGKEELKNPTDPEAAENRRVQIVNLGD